MSSKAGYSAVLKSSQKSKKQQISDKTSLTNNENSIINIELKQIDVKIEESTKPSLREPSKKAAVPTD